MMPMTTPCTLQWWLVLLLPILRIGGEHVKDTWYKKYPKYPTYCSTPEQMQTHAIPPLKDHLNTPFGETRLVHVTSVIRHGARTPLATGNHTCWNDYWTETPVWDCDLTTLVAPPMLATIEEEEGVPINYNDGDDFSFFLFEKKFDALRYPEDGLTNELNGTCEHGQLILQGYEQELTNGKILKDAYLYETDDYDHDVRMRLIHTTYIPGFQKAPWEDVKLRSDDDQRTVMSGQILLRGMFNQQVDDFVYVTGDFPLIHSHTADRSQDVLSPNRDICPRLELIVENARQSDEYQAFNNSEHANKTRDYIMKNLGTNIDDDNLLDCLMTSMCTDRPLPDAVDDYGKVGSRFEEVAEIQTVSYNKILRFNNSAYAQLAMMPLWTEIMDNIRPWLQQDPKSLSEKSAECTSPYDPACGGDGIDPCEYTEDPTCNDGDVDVDNFDAPKLSIVSGHDTTISPLLASLGPKLWNETTELPSYASMLLLEIHELIDGQADKSMYTTDFAFRLIYNGKVLTTLVPGCPVDAELCDVTHFLAIVDPYTTDARDCSVPVVEEPVNDVVVKTKKLMSTKEGFLLFLGLVIFSGMAGAVGTHRVLTGHFPCFGSGRETASSGADEEERIGLQNGFEDEPGDEDDFIGGSY